MWGGASLVEAQRCKADSCPIDPGSEAALPAIEACGGQKTAIDHHPHAPGGEEPQGSEAEAVDIQHQLSGSCDGQENSLYQEQHPGQPQRRLVFAKELPQADEQKVDDHDLAQLEETLPGIGRGRQGSGDGAMKNGKQAGGLDGEEDNVQPNESAPDANDQFGFKSLEAFRGRGFLFEPFCPASRP